MHPAVGFTDKLDGQRSPGCPEKRKELRELLERNAPGRQPPVWCSPRSLWGDWPAMMLLRRPCSLTKAPSRLPHLGTAWARVFLSSLRGTPACGWTGNADALLCRVWPRARWQVWCQESSGGLDELTGHQNREDLRDQPIPFTVQRVTEALSGVGSVSS